MKKIREEEHSISQPQPLEVVTDGDLEEVKKDPHEKENYNDAGGNPQKKDPVWKSWLEKREEEDLLPEDKPRPPTPEAPKRRKTEYTAQGIKVGAKEKKPKKEAFDLWDYKEQNQQKIRDQAQRIENQRRTYPDEEGKRGPKTGRERADRRDELNRKIRLDYHTERKRRNTEWNKQQTENNEELEAAFSSANKAGYVERVGEAMKSNMLFFGGKRDRKTGKKAKLKPRTITLDEFTEKSLELRMKILPLISAVGSIGRVAMGAISGDQKEMGEGGKDIGQASEQAEDEKKQ
jgi:hypothetical protein